MKVRVPASSANLGPGFDVLGLALSIYVTVEVNEAESLSIVSSGFGFDVPNNASHLAAVVAQEVLGHSNVSIEIDSQIPLARGLGSSAALSVAVAGACGAYDAFVVGSDFDGHCENAAASYFGGLVAGSRVGDSWEAISIPIDPRYGVIIVVPEIEIPTKDARAVLPKSIAFGDAVFNLGRMALLMGGLANIEAMRFEFGEDKLHEPYREVIFPGAITIKEILGDNGALLATWSGAGSSMIGLFDRYDIATSISTIRDELASANVAAEVFDVAIDTEGICFLEDLDDPDDLDDRS
ncbi:homoserine kinase [Acidithrix ferrooxidans]|uniref:Homoserine kinase n=1 Tax=Acidithrix ferrooxidans TaxID=1280514 RepID=A0A0D8HLX0_9ACTN|nr:homoserine kinase [Acidithrix ferrooxidans]KJF18995.1 homoserine kinase [Acidithrix ferrooxidans]